jgi:hypothetical protein
MFAHYPELPLPAVIRKGRFEPAHSGGLGS